MNLLDEILRPWPIETADRLPLVSILMMTYGRAAKQPDVLNEVVWWAANQDYPNVEVVVLNDAPGQIVLCDHPQVKVVNWPERLPDLGTKMNLLTLLAGGGICLVNDDDDVSLPWRVQQAVERLGTDYDYWPPRLWLYHYYGKEPRVDGNGYSYNCAAFRRDAMLGNHPKAIKGHDLEAARWAENNLWCCPDKLTDPRDVSFVYRWNVSQLHLSGHNDPVAAFGANDPGPPGVYRIQPKRGVDYVELHRKVTGSRPDRAVPATPV